MFEGASAVQARVGSGHRQIQRCARTRKSMETPFLARSIIARLIISNSCLIILLLLLLLTSYQGSFCWLVCVVLQKILQA